jgi:hypothetical protein
MRLNKEKGEGKILVELRGIESTSWIARTLFMRAPSYATPHKNDFPLPFHVHFVFVLFLYILNLISLPVSTYSTNKLTIWEVIIS